MPYKEFLLYFLQDSYIQSSFFELQLQISVNLYYEKRAGNLLFTYRCLLHKGMNLDCTVYWNVNVRKKYWFYLFKREPSHKFYEISRDFLLHNLWGENLKFLDLLVLRWFHEKVKCSFNITGQKSIKKKTQMIKMAKNIWLKEVTFHKSEGPNLKKIS